MRMPQMTVRKWFWSLLGLLALYLVLALRFDAGKPESGGVVTAQNGVSGIVNTLLLPAIWGIGKVQRIFSRSPEQALTPEQINDLPQVKEAASERLVLMAEIVRLSEELAAFTGMKERFTS